MKNVKLNKKGFSLIELMVVVAIIGILAAIAVPNFQRFQRKSRQAEARSMLASLYTAQQASAAELGCFPGNWPAIGFAPSGQLSYRIQSANNNVNCVIPNNAPGSTAADAACLGSDTLAACTTARANSYPAGSWTEGATATGVGGMPAGIATDNTTFLAGASARLTGMAVDDQWTIDQAKTLSNVQSGL